MRLPADDAQQAKHGYGQLADMMSLLEEELARAGFEPPLRDQMMIVWWKATCAQVMSPNLPDIGELFRGLLPNDDDDE